MAAPGGTSSAFGLQYQYLATIDRMLAVLVETDLLDKVSFTVETSGQDDDDSDIVDFGVRRDSRLVEAFQVKSSIDPSTANALSPNMIDEVFRRLSATADASAILLSNRRLSKNAIDRCSWRSTSGGIEEFMHHVSNRNGRPIECIVRIDSRSVFRLREDIVAKIQQIRKDQSFGQGLTSANLIQSALLDLTFSSAAGSVPQVISANQIMGLVTRPDYELAHAIGSFDWGLPISGVPYTHSSVLRLPLLDALNGDMNSSFASRAPSITVLQGTTGFGKTVVASEFVHMNRLNYEFVVWVDCADPAMIEPQIRRSVANLTKSTYGAIVSAGSEFVSVLGRLFGPWIVVFDNVRSRSQIQSYMPSSGSGFVVVTTSDSTGWWPKSTQLQVGPLSEEEAVECFELYSNIDTASMPGIRNTVRKIVQRLGRVPLAVSMAGLHFWNAGESVHSLAPAYFASLESLDDGLAVPPGYERTTFSAIRFAVWNLRRTPAGDTEIAKRAQALLYHSSLLSPDLIPADLVLNTTIDGREVEFKDLPKPAAVDEVTRGSVFSILRTQSLARRRLLLDEKGNRNIASESFSIHPLVQEILRSEFTKAAPVEAVINVSNGLLIELFTWIGELRVEGYFFAVEQLLAHAAALLSYLDGRKLSALDITDPEGFKAHIVAKLFLRMEYSTSLASKGNFVEARASLNLLLAEAALIEQDPIVVGTIAKGLSDVFVDSIYGKVDRSTVIELADKFIDYICKVEHLGTLQEPLLALAKQARPLLARQAQVGDGQSASVTTPLTRLQNFISENDASRDDIYDLVHRASVAANSGNHDLALAQVPSMRPLASTVYDRIAVDSLEAASAIRTGRFGSALEVIDRVLAQSFFGGHLAMVLSEWLPRIIAALVETSDEWGDFGVILEVRLNQLTERLDAVRDLDPS